MLCYAILCYDGQGQSGGVNDRFAYGDADSMLGGYMSQWQLQMIPAATDGVRMVDSEDLLCQHLVERRVVVGTTPLCIVRVRANGAPVQAGRSIA
jgi:hypothetical protein